MPNSSDYERARALIPVNNLMGCQFLTRACPRSCSYCGIVNSPLKDKILRAKAWPRVYDTLDMLGVSFNLILGNEVLYLRDALVDLVAHLKGGTPYALYTTAPEDLWEPIKDDLVAAGLQNLSMGCDYSRYTWGWPENILKLRPDAEQIMKSKRAFEVLRWAKDQGVPDTQATATVTMKNLDELAQMASDLTKIGVWMAVNLVHYDKDNRGLIDGFDFFPPRDAIPELVLDDQIKVMAAIENLRAARNQKDLMVFNDDESLDSVVEFYDTSWHCTQPNVITVDPDGRLRACGYRRGRHCNELSITDFWVDPEDATMRWLHAWQADMLECPGCLWAMWFSAENQDSKGAEVAQRYFGQHGTTGASEDQWANVDIGNKGQGVADLGHQGTRTGMVRKRGDWEKIKPRIEAWHPGTEL